MNETARSPSTWPDRVGGGLAGALILLGALALLAGLPGVRDFLLPVAVYAHLGPKAALAFVALGGALLALELGRPRGALIAVAALILAGLGGFESAGASATEIAARTAVRVPGAPMGPVLALGIGVAALMILWWRNPRAGDERAFVGATIGALLGATGLATLLGYATDLPAVFTWSTVATPPVGAVALVLLGLTFALNAWRESNRNDDFAPAWLPVPPMIVCLALTLLVWLGLTQREQLYVGQITRTHLDQFAEQSLDQLGRQAAQLERLARRLADNPRAAAELPPEAERHLRDNAELGCLALAGLDVAQRRTWTTPSPRGNPPPREPALDREHRGALAEAAVTGRTAIAGTRAGFASEPGNGFTLYAPVVHNAETAALVVAEYAYAPFFRSIASRAQLASSYAVSVTLGREVLFRSSDAVTGFEDQTMARTYTLADQRVRVAFTPMPAMVARNRPFLPELALAGGLGIAVLLGVSVHLARRAYAGRRSAEQLNAKLFSENDERRRMEARLKISDERLRVALDSTQIGIFEWNVTTAAVYYSPGLWAMFGYDASRMAATIDAWQSLVHPEDVITLRRRIEAQAKGIVTFIDPEYRVRTNAGDWRWVYMRSKSVATTASGEPLRIVGTIQDITARREAEVALRASQAEARKLSLVAAHTDSPVLIGRADGTIEWANEAFCRVMEYRLDEVVGQTPWHFMIGPDTDTAAHIRTAIAQGAAVSTDVVSASKSGRKYHLHVELQPVRGSGGKVENFVAVQTDITARVETEEQLRRAKSEADDASRAKSDFLASMSHEIRTPMNGVIGMTSLLLESKLTAEQRDCVGTIRTSGEALLTIINDILDFSKIESGKLELENSAFELSLCIEDALDLFALQASAKRLELGYFIAPDVPTWIMGDATRLRQVVVNLVNNAVKFTPSGSVSVQVRRHVRPAGTLEFDPALVSDPTQVTLEFTVSDTGIGIPPGRIDRLFKAFSQVDSSTTRKYGGTGLGLAISHRLCELMGGTIRAESRPSRGTTFLFTLPTTVAPACSDSGLSTTPEPLRGGWVLCVEDHPVTQARIQSIVANWGIECVCVPHASEAQAAAAKRAQPPALLIVDTEDLSHRAAQAAALAPFGCPQMLLHPFGQPTPMLNERVPTAATTKPLRNIAFILGVIGLFQSAARAANSTRTIERPVGEDIPLEVLLAEDNAVNQKVALRFLERLGYRADAVANGLEAVTTLENRRYDLVLMDLQMPEMDGFEATRQIRVRLPRERQPRIVALTANAMQGDREACAAAGMDDFITKPVKMHEIADMIRRQFRPSDDRRATRSSPDFGAS